jgi:alkanesulfonate monooxygenase SsuD/methylene tetrahydromethanopterin reductase-like flavin-dependent oxidoreductase (luciferase family)
VDPAAGERPITPEAPPLEGTAGQLAGRLRELADAGADEVILVVSPITKRSIRLLGDVVAAV